MMNKIKHIPEPMLREISFSGNMPSPYEKNLKKALKTKPLKISPIKINK